MMFKKWKPLWSYDIDKTENWLREMASKGHRLIGVNRLTRLFSFETASRKEIDYHISFDKHQQDLSLTLTNAGWRKGVDAGNWSVLENDYETIELFPSRDNLIKRNRLHSLIWRIISIYYGIQLVLPVFLVMVVLIAGGDVEVESSSFWIFTFLYFAQVIGVVVLTMIMTKKLRKFERKYYDMEVDLSPSVGKTFAKWKPNWMVSLDLTEKWLEDMSLKGNHLVKVQATRFVFEKGHPKKVAYALDFQWRTSPVYIEMHKSTGWKFIYTSGQSIFKTSIWAKEYALDEEKPQLTYEANERKSLKRRVVILQGGSTLFTLVVVGFIAWNFGNQQQLFDGSMYHSFLTIGLIIGILLQLYSFSRVIRYALKG